jgi:hypothetical protein
MKTPETIYMISGCGISAMCGLDGLSYWIQRIIQKGGYPEIKVWTDEEAA